MQAETLKRGRGRPRKDQTKKAPRIEVGSLTESGATETDHPNLQLVMDSSSEEDDEEPPLNKIVSDSLVSGRVLVIRETPGAIFPLLRTTFLYMRKDKCVVSASPHIKIPPELAGTISRDDFDSRIARLSASPVMDAAELFATLCTLSDYKPFFESEQCLSLVDNIIRRTPVKESRTCAAVLVRCGLDPFKSSDGKQSPITRALLHKNYGAFEGFVSVPCRGYQPGDFSFATFNFVVVAYVHDFVDKSLTAMRVCARMVQSAIEIKRVSENYPVHEAESVQFAFYIINLFFGKCAHLDFNNAIQMVHLPRWENPGLKKIINDMHSLYLNNGEQRNNPRIK